MKKPLMLILGITVLALSLRLGVSADDTNANQVAAADKTKASAIKAPSPRIAASRIVHVTVYPNSALVTREVETPPGEGTFELVVSPLPPLTLDSSLYSEGNEGQRVLSTRYRTRPVREDTRDEVRRLEDELRTLRVAEQKLQADLQAAEQNQQLLEKLENFTAISTKTADKTPVNSESMIALATYVMESRATRAKELVGLQQEIELNKEQADFLRRRLSDLTAGTTRVERDAVIVVDKVDPAAGQVRLNYLVSAASWQPQYKFRGGKGDKEFVRLEYLAGIVQHTGEDWSNVQIVLSTAQPTLNAAPPDLQVLQVAVVPRSSSSLNRSTSGMQLDERLRQLYSLN